jgi:hypothetical protein
MALLANSVGNGRLVVHDGLRPTTLALHDPPVRTCDDGGPSMKTSCQPIVWTPVRPVYFSYAYFRADFFFLFSMEHKRDLPDTLS